MSDLNTSIQQSAAVPANKSKRALAMREDKQRRVKVARFRRACIVFFAVLLPVLMMVLLTVDYVYRTDSFAIEELRFQGRFKRVDIATVERAAHAAVVGNFFTVDLDDLRQRVKDVNWVRAVNVRREWPNKLIVDIAEHEPLMRWDDEGWVSRSGEIVLSDTVVSSQHFPVLHGAPQYVTEMLAFGQYWQQQLSTHNLVLEELHRSSSKAWTVKLSYTSKFVIAESDTENAGQDDSEKTNAEEGSLEQSEGVNRDVATEQWGERQQYLSLLLGSEDVQKRLDRFLRMYAQDSRLLAASQLVDARYPNGLAIVPSVSSNSDKEVATKRLSSL